MKSFYDWKHIILVSRQSYVALLLNPLHMISNCMGLPVVFHSARELSYLLPNTDERHEGALVIQ